MTSTQEIIAKARKKEEAMRNLVKVFSEQNKQFFDKNGIPKFGIDPDRIEKKWKEFKEFWRTGGNQNNRH